LFVLSLDTLISNGIDAGAGLLRALNAIVGPTEHTESSGQLPRQSAG